MNTFKNRFPQFKRWEDRICDSDYHPDYDARFYSDNPDMMKYDIYLAYGWAWEKPSHGYDCHRTESFHTIKDAMGALRHAVRMDFNAEPCISCPHYTNGECNA